MSGSSGERFVPVWMLVVFWVFALPMLIDGEYWLWMKAPLYTVLIVMTIGLVRHREGLGGSSDETL